MTDQAPIYACPLCESARAPWRLYPVLGLPICDDCDAALLDDEAILAAACQFFSVTPDLLAQIVERQQPLVVASNALARRFAGLPPTV
jgi:hypothetical protein